MTPSAPMAMGRDRIARLREVPPLSQVERWILEQVRAAGDAARIVVFRAVNDQNECVWRFDPELDDDELKEAGYLFSRAILPLHRRLLAIGVVLMVHTEWGLRECHAMRH